jgi:hypothetical protein
MEGGSALVYRSMHLFIKYSKVLVGEVRSLLQHEYIISSHLTMETASCNKFHIRKKIFHLCACVLHVPVECWAARKICVTVRLTCFNCSI